MRRRKENHKNIGKIFFWVLLCIPFFATAQMQDTIQCAWYTWKPYQYINSQGELAGLDHALITHIFREAKIEVVYNSRERDSWEKNQSDVLEGKKTFTSGAFWTSEREEQYFVSNPYRHEWNTMYVLKAEKELSKIMNLNQLLDYIKENGLKLGVIAGYKYSSHIINSFIDQYGDQEKYVVKSLDEEGNFNKLVEGKANIIIADRITGAQIIWKNRNLWNRTVSEHMIRLPSKPIHLLMHKSKDSLLYKKNKLLMDKFNTSLAQLEKKGVLNDLIANYLFPVLMNITVQTQWFQLIDYIGAIFFAIAGFLIARENRFDIFGTIVMVNLLTSGGGVLRDILVGKTPSFLQDVTYLYIILSVSFLGFIATYLHLYLIQKYEEYYEWMHRYTKRFVVIRMSIESIALGAYTIIGVGIAVEMNLRPLWIWGPFLGVLTSCGGGIIADCLLKDRNNNSFKGHIDPEISMLGAIGFSFFLLWQVNRLNPNEVFLGVLVTIIAMAAIFYILLLLRAKSPSLKLDNDIINKNKLNHEKEKNT